MGGHVACTRVKRSAYRFLILVPEGEKTRGRHRYRWEDNMETCLRDRGRLWTGFNWPTSGNSCSCEQGQIFRFH
jgi:hypothetical protein